MSGAATITHPQTDNWAVGIAGLAIVAALVLGVGPVSNTILHHMVQTLPFWVVVGLRRRPVAVWFALPCFLFWLVIMAAIWLFLLHLPTFVHGHFSPIEIAMTLVTSIASVAGVVAAFKSRGARLWPAVLASFWARRRSMPASRSVKSRSSGDTDSCLGAGVQRS